MRLLRHVCHREVTAEFRAKAAHGMSIVRMDTRKAFIDQTLDAYLDYMGSEHSLADMQKQRETDAVTQYEELMQSRFKLSLAQAGRTLADAMTAREDVSSGRQANRRG